MRNATIPEARLAIAMAAVAGFVDAIGFISLGGYFVSFMSGNSTRLAFNIASSDWIAVLVPAGMIALFVAGVTLGSLIGRRVRRRRNEAILSAITLLLAVAGCFSMSDMVWPVPAIATMAMGATNTILDRDETNTIPLTYMTGALVKIGLGLSAAIAGAADKHWLRHVALWLGLLAGAVMGALAFGVFGVSAIWVAAMSTGLLTVLCMQGKARKAHDDGCT